MPTEGKVFIMVFKSNFGPFQLFINLKILSNLNPFIIRKDGPNTSISIMDNITTTKSNKFDQSLTYSNNPKVHNYTTVSTKNTKEKM